MSMLGSLLIVVVVVAVLAIVQRCGPRLFPGTRTVSSALWCPSRKRDLDVDLRVTAWDGRAVDIERCAAFDPPTAVVCEKACLAERQGAGISRRRS